MFVIMYQNLNDGKHNSASTTTKKSMLQAHA